MSHPRLNDKLDELAVELEEWPFGRHPSVDLPFDPGKHPRDRFGKFHGAVSRLEGQDHAQLVTPNGVTVRKHGALRHGFVVEGGDAARGPVRVHTAAGAVAEALDRHDRADIARGADPEESHFGRIHEFSEARRTAMKDSVSDTEHIEGLMRQARRERTARAEPIPANRAGRSRVAVARYQAQHAGRRPAG